MSKSFTRTRFGIFAIFGFIGSFLIGRLQLSLLFDSILFAGFIVFLMIGLTLWDRYHSQ